MKHTTDITKLVGRGVSVTKPAAAPNATRTVRPNRLNRGGRGVEDIRQITGAVRVSEPARLARQRDRKPRADGFVPGKDG